MTILTLPISTERLVLRSFEKSDLDGLAAYYTLPEVQRYVDWKARDRVELKAALDGMIKQRRLHRPGDAVALAVCAKSDDTVIGHVSLCWTDATAGQAELRFAFNPQHRGQGYAVEAVRAALIFGFDSLSFHRIFARCGASSEGPARLMKKIGMRLEAHYLEHALFQGEWDEELHFAILDREWRRGAKVKEINRHMVA